MGWNPFKTVKKVVKSIGKGIKKIGKGLKKIMAKIAKPFAKLGIVGQIALGFLMPWAAGAIWTGLTGTTFSLASMGTVAGNLTASSNIFAKAAGYVMKGVHWGATKVQNAYQYVTDKISSGIDTLTGRAKETLGPTADAGDLINDAVQNGPDIEQVTLTPEQITQQAKDSAKSLFERIDSGDLAPKATTDDLGDLFDTDLFTSKDSIALKAEDSVAALQKKIVGEATKVDKGFFGKVKESFSTALAEAPSTISKQIVTSAATGIGDMVKQGIVGEAEMGSYAQYDVPDFLSLSAQDAYTKYNQVDLTMQNNSFAYGGPSYMANLQETGFTSDPYFDYFNRMLGRG
jgi:hypothetical protein